MALTLNRSPSAILVLSTCISPRASGVGVGVGVGVGGTGVAVGVGVGMNGVGVGAGDGAGVAVGVDGRGAGVFTGVAVAAPTGMVALARRWSSSDASKCTVTEPPAQPVMVNLERETTIRETSSPAFPITDGGQLSPSTATPVPETRNL